MENIVGDSLYENGGSHKFPLGDTLRVAAGSFCEI
jgi:hypothetical protein